MRIKKPLVSEFTYLETLPETTYFGAKINLYECSCGVMVTLPNRDVCTCKVTSCGCTELYKERATARERKEKRRIRRILNKMKKIDTFFNEEREQIIKDYEEYMARLHIVGEDYAKEDD